VSELVALVAALTLVGARASWSGLPVRSEFGMARGGGRAKCDHAGHVAVDGSVSAGIGNVTVEGGDSAEEGGIGFGIAFEIFYVGKNAS